MDELTLALKALSEAEQKEFERFLQLRRVKQNRKDIELLKQLLKSGLPKKKNKKESDRVNRNRMRLWNSLADFSVVKEMDDASSPIAKIVSYVSLARFLFKNRLQKSGWKFLDKAEQLAFSSYHHFILKSIYLLKLENSHYEYGVDIPELLKKIKINNKILEKNEKLLVASNYVKHILKKEKSVSSTSDLGLKIKSALKKFKLDLNDFELPNQVHQFLEIIRSSSLAVNDLKEFQQLIIQQYERLSKQKKFDIYSHYYRLDILYMICHACFRNRDFFTAEKYLKILNENILLFNDDYLTRYYPKYIALLSNILALTGKLDRAINLAEEIAKQKKMKISIKDAYNNSLNLVVFNFYKRKFKTANKFYLFVPHTDEFLIKKMGVEWVMRKNLIHAILQYELGNEDICLSIIKKLERKNNDILRKSSNKRVKLYLDFVKRYIQDPMNFPKEKFYLEGDETLFTKAFDMEEYKDMAFYGWLKSKVEKRDYYEIVLELVK